METSTPMPKTPIHAVKTLLEAKIERLKKTVELLKEENNSLGPNKNLSRKQRQSAGAKRSWARRKAAEHEHEN